MKPASEIYNEDCYEVLKRLHDNSVDLLLQDPPFGVTQNSWDVKSDLKKMWPEWLSVCKPNGAMVFFATQPFVTELITSQPQLFRCDLIWYKTLGTGFLNAGKMPLRNHEHILVFYRALPVYNPQFGIGIRKKGIVSQNRNGSNYGAFTESGPKKHFDNEGKRFPQSVIEFTNGNKNVESDHPTQKPIDLIRYLILTYSNPGDLVFDGYLGSGTTVIAAYLEGRNFIGAELDKDYYNQILKRFKEQTSQLPLF